MIWQDLTQVFEACFTYAGLTSNAVTDNLLNNAGTAGVRVLGSLLDPHTVMVVM